MSITARTLASLLVAASAPLVSHAQVLSNAFTYQGRLTDAGGAANGAYDFQFKLFDAVSGGAQVGVTVVVNDLTVASGLFTTRLDFADQFNGNPRWLQIEVRPGASTGAYSILAPRTELTAAPYASQARSAFALDAADGSPASAVFVDNNGNVGIGTTTPGSPLHVIAPSAGATPGEGIRIQGPLPTVANTAYLSFLNSAGTALGYVGDGSSGDNTIFVGAYGGDVSLVTSTGGRVITATAAGNLNLGVGSGDYKHIRIGGGNSDGFVYGSYPRWGDGIHMGYNYYANAVGADQIIHPDGGTSRLSTGYGFIILATAAPFGGAPVDRFWIDPAGAAYFTESASVKTLQIRGGSDLAEPFDVSAEGKPAPGMVVVIDPSHPGELKVSGGAYDTKVAGVISGANGLPTGMVMKSDGQAMADGDHPIALTGRVWCYADASGAPIEPGDLLTTSDVPGHAMKAADASRAGGAVIGKAMTALKDGRGMVLVLVNLQ